MSTEERRPIFSVIDWGTITGVSTPLSLASVLADGEIYLFSNIPGYSDELAFKIGNGSTTLTNLPWRIFTTDKCKEYSNDLNDIAVNSIYNIDTNEVTSAPAFPVTGKWAFIYTLMHPYSSQAYRTQICYAMNDNPGYIYIRHRATSGWTQWYKLWTETTDGPGSGMNADLLDGAHLSTNTNLGTSNTLVPSQNAVKTYVDNKITSGTMDTIWTGTATSGTQTLSSGYKFSDYDTLRFTSKSTGNNLSTTDITLNNWQDCNGTIHNGLTVGFGASYIVYIRYISDTSFSVTYASNEWMLKVEGIKL